MYAVCRMTGSAVKKKLEARFMCWRTAAATLNAHKKGMWQVSKNEKLAKHFLNFMTNSQ